MSLLWRSQSRFLLRHPLLAALTVLGVALGIAVIHATDLANRSASASLAEAHRELHGFARYRIVGSGGPIAEQDYAALRRRILAQHPAWHLLPVISGTLKVRGETWQLLGVDVIADPRLDDRAPPLSDKGGRQGRNGGRPLALIGSDSALLSRQGAAALGVRSDDVLPVATAAGAHSLRIAGLFDDSRGLLAHLLVCDIGTAQRLLAMPGRLSYIELAGADELDARELESVRALLPPGLQLLASQALLAGQNALLDAFQFNLSALSALALLVGCLLMFSAAQFSFYQRRPLLDRLYWLGADRRRLLLNLLLEGALIAAVACAAGWLLGIALSHVLLPVAAGTINELFAAQTIVRFGGAPRDYLKTALLALTAMLSAQGFLFRQWRRGRSDGQPFPGRRGRAYWWSTLALAALAVGALRAPGATLAAGFAALFALSGAWLLLAPELYRGALQWLGRLRLSALSTIALRDSRRHYRRLALALAALCLALAAGLGIDVMVDSFRRSLLDWLQQQVAADFYIGADAARMPALREQLRRDPRIAALSLSRRTALMVDAAPVTLQALDLPEQARSVYPLIASHSADPWRELRGDALIAGEPLARKWGLAPGSRLTLPTPRGPRVFTVAAISRDYSTEYGRIVISGDTYRRLWNDDTVDSIGVYLRPGAARAALYRSWIDAGLQVSDGARIKAEIASLFDRTFVITRLLQLLVSAVALAALISTLLIHQLMQRRQLATLRALGLSQAGLLRLLLWQTLPLGLSAGLLALPLGYALAWLLVGEINPRAFGWSLSFHPGIAAALYTLPLAVALAALASLYPAWRGARLPIAGELSRE